MVVTGEGILELGELVDQNGDTWQELDTTTPQEVGTEKVTAGFVNGVQPTRVITLHSGARLNATLNHQYRVLSGDKYSWKHVRDISPGDKLVSKIGGYEGEDRPLITSHYEHDRASGAQPKAITCPEVMTPELAWWLGLYHADGSNHERSIRVSLGKNKRRASELFQRLTSSLFCVKATVSSERRYEMDNISIGSRDLLHFLKINGMLKGKSQSVSIPEVVRRSSADSVRAFIAGYRAGDGSYTGNTEYIDTTSEVMARQLFACLRATGQNARIVAKNDRSGSLGNSTLYRVYNVGYGSEGFTRYKRLSKALRADLDTLSLIGDGLVPDEVVAVEDSESMTLDLSVPVNNTYVAGSVLSHNTIAKMPGVSEGIHPIFSKYFIRRIRFSKNDPDQVATLDRYEADGYEVQDDLYAANTGVVSIPTKDSLLEAVEAIWGPEKADAVVESAADLTLNEMLAFQALYQACWADNAVSFTANVDPETYTADDVRQTLRKFGGRLKGMTCFPESSMPQSPYERISREQYDEATTKDVSDGVDPECASGSCPVR